MNGLKTTFISLALGFGLIAGVLGLFNGYTTAKAQVIEPSVAELPIAASQISALQMQSQVTLTPTKDNTIFDPNGDRSNGQGPNLYVGRTNNGVVMRGLLAFDVANSIPASSTINSVSLRLNVSQVAPGGGPQTVGLFKLSADWGEGDSFDAPGGAGVWADAQANDATWTHRFYSTTVWTTMGGDFVATASASQTINNSGVYTWDTTAQMVADVQAWLETPGSNYGWILKMDDEATNKTAKRLDSAENGTIANRPMLIIDYTPPPPPPLLTLSKSVNQATPELGETIIYTVIASNTNSSVVTEAVVSDMLPAGLSLTGTISLDPPDAGSVGTLPILANGLTISSGHQITLTFSAVVSPSLSNGTILTNTATITSTTIPTPTEDTAVIRVGIQTVFLPIVLKS